MKLTIIINLDGAAFNTKPRSIEVVHALRKYADCLIVHPFWLGHTITLYDSNSNRCGTAEITEEEG